MIFKNCYCLLISGHEDSPPGSFSPSPASPEMKPLLTLWFCQMPNPSGREAANLSEGQVEPVTLATGTWS